MTVAGKEGEESPWPRPLQIKFQAWRVSVKPSLQALDLALDPKSVWTTQGCPPSKAIWPPNYSGLRSFMPFKWPGFSGFHLMIATPMTFHMATPSIRTRKCKDGSMLGFPSVWQHCGSLNVSGSHKHIGVAFLGSVTLLVVDSFL